MKLILFQMYIKIRFIKVILITILLIGANPLVYANKALVQSKNCLSCHHSNKQLIGPSIQAIAEKYSQSNQADLVLLANKIREGSVGVWGSIPMAANPQVSLLESEQLLRWFLMGEYNNN